MTILPSSQARDCDEHPKLPLGVHAVAWVGTGVFVGVLTVLVERYKGQNVWSSWVASGELRKTNYAEAIHMADVFRTQANTWSNLAYVLVGLYAVGLGMYDWTHRSSRDSNYVVSTPAMSILFGIACCYLGLGSGLFHASLARWGQQLDVGAMYAPLLVCIAINIGRYLSMIPGLGGIGRVPSWPLLATLVIISCYLLFRYKWSMSSSQVLPAHILIVIVFAIIDSIPPRRNLLGVRWLVVAGLSLVLAILCRQLDIAGRFSTAESWLQGHALWHVLTANSLGCMYGYYRSEVVACRKGDGGNYGMFGLR